MFGIERKAFEWIERHLLLCFFALTTVISLFVRYSLRDYISYDYTAYLQPWYATFQELGVRKALSGQIGNYNLPYQFLIAVMTKLPIEPLYAFKLLSCVFDYVLALAAASLVRLCMGGKGPFWRDVLGQTKTGWYCAAGYAAILFLPTRGLLEKDHPAGMRLADLSADPVRLVSLPICGHGYDGSCAFELFCLRRLSPFHSTKAVCVR